LTAHEPLLVECGVENGDWKITTSKVPAAKTDFQLDW
jgi:hypothetical protein